MQAPTSSKKTSTVAPQCQTETRTSTAHKTRSTDPKTTPLMTLKNIAHRNCNPLGHGRHGGLQEPGQVLLQWASSRPLLKYLALQWLVGLEMWSCKLKEHLCITVFIYLYRPANINWDYQISVYLICSKKNKWRWTLNNWLLSKSERSRSDQRCQHPNLRKLKI